MSDWVEKFKLQDEVVAAGVSGGADSLALVFRLRDCGVKVVALTVNHGLRPEAAAEADYVAQLMAAAGIEHHILVWEGDKPLSGIEEAARQARYSLMFSWCARHGVKTLAVGHHRRDQAETFLLRLQRGSGLYGLCAMLPESRRGDIRIIRPQLEDSPEMLREYLGSRGIRWVEDASNQCEDFMRVKIRNCLPELEQKLGLSERRLAETAAVLARTRAFLEEQCDGFVRNQVRIWEEGLFFSLSRQQLSSRHPELRYRILAHLLQQAGKTVYPPEAEEILRLGQQLENPDFKGCTLGGCEIFAAQNRLWIVPECRQRQVLSKEEWEKCLQNRPQYAKAKLPYKVRRAIFNQWMMCEDGKRKEK